MLGVNSCHQLFPENKTSFVYMLTRNSLRREGIIALLFPEIIVPNSLTYE